MQAPKSSTTLRIGVFCIAICAVSSFVAKAGGYSTGWRWSRYSSTVAYSSSPHPDPSQQKLPWQMHPRNANERDKLEEGAVDEYLEFLERRYRRIHNEDSLQTKAKFSAWNWLKHELVADTLSAEQQQSQEDALYVLGVAGLASKKLLQRHHIPVQQIEKMKAVDMRPKKAVIDVEAPVDVETTRAAILLSKLSNLLARLSHIRKAIHRYQDRSIHAVRRTLTRGPLTLGKKLLKSGGGMRNMAVTLAVSIAVAHVLLHFVLPFVASEGRNLAQRA